MEPSITQGSVIKYTRKRGCASLSLGALVIVKSPNDAREVWLRRVLGLPGQRINIDQTRVSIDDQPLELALLGLPPGTDFGGIFQTLVPKDQIYLVGDNAATALDSRILGPFLCRDVVGMVVPEIKHNSESN
jgi:signal peptidase I